MMKAPLHKQAFSLVELSIVLVILGLLTGGVLTGQSLIRAAELRSVTTEFQKYQTAVMTFRDKYFAIPGDMKNATDFWGEANSTPATCIRTESTDTKTCNGNGDGEIWLSTESYEPHRFWQHLANAGLIEGSYTGTYGASAADAILGVNVPQGKLSNGGWYIRTEQAAFSGSASFFDGDYGTRYIFGADGGTGNITQAAILSPEEAWNIDTKVDDGKPGRGKVRVIYYTPCTLAVNETELDANYELTNSDIACALSFLVN